MIDTMVLMAIIVALLGGVVLLRWPYLAAPAFAFMIYIRLSDVLRSAHGAPSIFKFLAPGLLLLVGIRWLFFDEEPGESWKPAAALLFAYGLVGAASLLYTAEPSRTLEDLSNFLDGVAIVLVITTLIRTNETAHAVLWAILLAGLFLGALTTIQRLTGNLENDFGGFAKVSELNIVEGTSGGRSEGPVSTNYFALILVVLVPLAIDRMARASSLVLRAVAGTALFTMLAAIIFTYSRGGFLALAVVLVLSLLRMHIKPIWFLAAVPVVFAVAMVSLPADYLQRIAALTEVADVASGETTSDGALRGRFSEMASALAMFQDHPAVGVGLGNFENHYHEYAQEIGLDGRRSERQAHSLFLEVAAETGLVGLLVLTSMMLYAGASIVTARAALLQQGLASQASAVSAFGVGLIGYLTGSVFLHLTFPRYFWLLFGIALALSAAARVTLRSARQNEAWVMRSHPDALHPPDGGCRPQGGTG